MLIDLSESHIWDASTVATLDAITTKYARYGKTVEIVGLNASSAERLQRRTTPAPGRKARRRPLTGMDDLVPQPEHPVAPGVGEEQSETGRRLAVGQFGSVEEGWRAESTDRGREDEKRRP
ncbi:hypothetical protein GCM10009744_57930 [Kribbella alba]|uniref:STAS domain-containing protein n=1 Tax=Kribbella alba TaxID=190197 RepID=A0ABN2FSL3_9ACTN